MMANGGRRTANGESRMANGEWRTANGEWRMANREPRTANREPRKRNDRARRNAPGPLPLNYGLLSRCSVGGRRLRRLRRRLLPALHCALALDLLHVRAQLGIVIGQLATDQV